MRIHNEGRKKKIWVHQVSIENKNTGKTGIKISGSPKILTRTKSI